REAAARERADARKNQVGSGDRSERIRTYNFPQGRVTDHRINLTLYSLPKGVEGDLDELTNALIAEDQAPRLASLEAEKARALSVDRATIDWTLDGDFLARRYSRAHTLSFDGGLSAPGTASPHVVPLPWSREDALDPEAAFTASLSACHMLWFLDFA